MEPMGRENLYPKTPSIQILPTLGSKVYKHYLLWAIWGLRVSEASLPAALRLHPIELLDVPGRRMVLDLDGFGFTLTPKEPTVLKP